MLLISAAALIIFIGLAHSYLGEKYLLMRLFRRKDLPVILGSETATKQTLRFAWHITSIAWWGIAGLLIAMQMSPGSAYQAALWMCVIVFGISAFIPIANGGSHKSWIIFGAIAVICAYAAMIGSAP